MDGRAVWRSGRLRDIIPLASKTLPVSRVQNSFDDDGDPRDEAYERRAALTAEVLFFAEAVAVRKAKYGQ